MVSQNERRLVKPLPKDFSHHDNLSLRMSFFLLTFLSVFPCTGKSMSLFLKKVVLEVGVYCNTEGFTWTLTQNNCNK